MQLPDGHIQVLPVGADVLGAGCCLVRSVSLLHSSSSGTCKLLYPKYNRAAQILADHLQLILALQASRLALRIQDC